MREKSPIDRLSITKNLFLCRKLCEKLWGELWGFLLDQAFPQPEEIVYIEKLGVQEFLKIAHSAGPTPHFDLYACRMYKDSLVKKAVMEFKYRKNHAITKLFAEVMCEYVQILSAEKILLVPIPAHPSRLTEYGFNQTELLARAMEELRPEQFLYCDVLVYERKERGRGAQKLKGRSDRLESAERIFKVKNQTAVSGRKIIIIDDVITTGATCLDAIRAVQEAGAVRAVALAIAH